jgi:threonine dehydratase
MKNAKILQMIKSTRTKLKHILKPSPLQYNSRLSKKYNSNIYIKREDLLQVRSFKIRGAYNKIINLNQKEKEDGIVCASAGNHAQGVALSCSNLKIKGDIFIPEQTPQQKVDRINFFGNNYCNIYKIGKDFNECLEESLHFCQKNNKVFIHPYDDMDTIIGQSRNDVWYIIIY